MLPYELIGKGVVGIVFSFLIAIIIATIILAVLWIWNKSLTFISNMIWRNYDIEKGEEPPPQWRKVSAFVIMLRDNNFDKKDKIWEEIENTDRGIEKQETD